MTKSYSNENKRKTVFEPNLSRQRLPYKGPVPSNVLNLYYDQFIVDYSRLSKHAEELEEMLLDAASDYSNVFDSATPDYYIDNSISAVMYSNYYTYSSSLSQYSLVSATPYYDNKLQFNKQIINSSKLSLINNKLLMLEDLIGKKE